MKQKEKNGILIPQHDNEGYNIVYLEKDGVETPHRVDQLVWQAFKGKIPEGMEIYHLDGNKLNDRLDNLRLIPTNK